MEKPKYKTLFAQQQEPANGNPPHEHPLFYFQERNNFLSSLSDKYSSKYRLPTMDLRRNVRVDYYLKKYEQTNSEISKDQAKKKSYLNSNEFDTVFGNVIDQRRKRNIQKKEQEKLRKDLYAHYLRENQQHEQPEHDKSIQVEPEQYQTILKDFRTDPIAKKELYLLDLEIGKFQLEQRVNKKVKFDRESCRDMDLISRMSNNILSAYMVHFDEIFSLLIDEVLVEQVYYLNYLEAEYKVEKAQWRGTQIRQDQVRFENAKTIQMMELVKGLEDLCDD